MTEFISNIQDVKNESWNLVKCCLEKDIDIEKIFIQKEGKDFLDIVYKNRKIAKFQWNYESNGTYNNLLTHYLKYFFIKILNYTKNKGLDRDSTALKVFFDEKFDLLEKEVLLSDSFNYLLLIPTFGAIFPSGIKEFILDSNHLLKDITDIDQPYNLKSFKETPKSWKHYTLDKPNASLEVKFSLNKKLSNDTPYEEGLTPFYPSGLYSNRDIFNEKLKSIHDFFICYGEKYSPGFFTFGDVYFAELPPFSQSYKHMKCYTYYGFPPPQRQLYLEYPGKAKQPIDWKKMWKKNYNNFYQTFYSYDITFADVENFRYAMDVLVAIRNIPYSNVSNFLLVSTLEGLLFLDSIKNKLKLSKGDKKNTVTKTFVEISADNNEYWQWIFPRKYPLKPPLKSFATKQDLEDFIISCFIYRNNIAHPEKKIPINLKPKHLIPPSSKESEEFILERLISQVFPSFLIFLIRTWLKKGFKSRTDWEIYLKSLFP